MRNRLWRAYGEQMCFVVFLLITSAAACTREDPLVGQYYLKLEEWNGGAAVSAADFSKMFEQNVSRVMESKRLLEQPVTMFVSGGVVADGRESAMLLQVRISFVGRTVPLEIHYATVSPGTSKKTARSLVRRTLVDLAGGAQSMLRIYLGTPADWRRSLQSPEPDEQILAIRLLAFHRIVGAVDSISRLLDDPRNQVASEAVEALGVLRAEASVPRIIEVATRSNPMLETRCIQSIADIGGPEALAYLEMIAGGHENDEIRRMSTDLLKRLKSRP